MNIGIVTAWFESGAGYVSKAYRDVLTLNHEVYVYARGGDYALEDLANAKSNSVWNQPYVTWGKKGLPFVLTSLHLEDFKEWLDKYKIELVIFNEQHYWTPVIVCSELRIKVGAYVDYYNENTISLFACYDFLLCNTKRHYSAFAWHPQCYYIPWGTDVQLYKPNSPTPVNTGSITFFHSAYHSPDRKGTDLVIRAFSKLSHNARLVVHTKRENLYTTYPDVTETIRQLEDEGRLEIRNETVSAPGLYHLGDVYVYPSRLEGIGLTVPEALSCGLPGIVSDNPPMNEFVKNGVNGHLVAVDKLTARADGYYWPVCHPNLADLVEKFNFYIQNKDDLPQYKKQAREFAVQNLDWSRNASGLGDIIVSVKFLSNSFKAEAADKAIKFENDRLRLHSKYPKIYKTVKSILKLKDWISKTNRLVKK